MLLTIVSSSAIADWAKVAENEKFTVYADDINIRANGNMIRMRSLLDYKTTQNLAHIPHLSMVSQDEYDCKKDQLRFLSMSFHSEIMGEGHMVYFDTMTGTWNHVLQGSVGEALLETACRKR